MLPDFPDEAAVRAVGLGLLDRSLPKARWTHAGHFAAALWLLREGRAGEMPELIRAYNTAVGTANTDSSGYHETITLASLAGACRILAATGGAPLHEALAQLMAGPMGRPDWLLSYWAHDRLFSVEARRGWVEPDVKPLPF